MGKALAVGDKTYLVQHYGWGCRPQYTPGVVQKVTPTGLIDIVVGFGKEPTRFKADGSQQGTRHGYLIDEMGFAEREVDIARTERIEAACNALQAIEPEKLRNPEVLDLVKEHERLQTALNEVRKLIDAV